VPSMLVAARHTARHLDMMCMVHRRAIAACCTANTTTVTVWYNVHELYSIVLQTRDGGATWDPRTFGNLDAEEEINYRFEKVCYILCSNNITKRVDLRRLVMLCDLNRYCISYYLKSNYVKLELPCC
jgi:hypothetical protein